jgi:hypothetical protein
MQQVVELNTIRLWGADVQFQLRVDGDRIQLSVPRHLLLATRPDEGDPFLPPERLLVSKLLEIQPLIEQALSRRRDGIVRIA